MKFDDLLPFRRVSSFDGVIQGFEELFRQGVLKPGVKLPSEAELARTFNVARPTLREALKALGILGLLVSKTGNGTYVGGGSTDLFKRAIYFSTLLRSTDFGAVLETRVAIEPFAAELAAQRATKEDLRRMQECLRRMEMSLEVVDEYAPSEEGFHHAVINAARSSILQSIMEAIDDLLIESRMTVTPNQADKRDLEFHVRIFEAIRGRKPLLARRRMLEHLARNQKRYEAFYQNRKIANVAGLSFLPQAGSPRCGE